MATVNKNFRIKNGLVVEGSTATVNGQNILTETGSDSYILNLIGGETLVKSVDTNVFNVDNTGNLTINSNVFDEYGAASTAQAAAENYANSLATNYDAAGAADSAYNNAVSYVDGEIADALNTAQGYATDAAANANSYTDGREAAITIAYQDYTNALINDSSSTTTNVWSAYKTSSEINSAVSNLVDSAPELLNTLNELAAAIADNPNYATDMAASLSAKQNTLTAGSNIDISSDVISVTGLDSADISDFNTAALSATSAAYDVVGSATTAQTAAETTAQNALNAVLDGTTSFTEVSIDWMIKHVAAYAYEYTDSETVAYSWNKNMGASAKFLVRIKNGSHSQVSEVLITRDDTNNIAITEYAIVTTNGVLGDITAAINGNNIDLKVTPEHTGGTEIFISGTLMYYSD